MSTPSESQSPPSEIQFRIGRPLFVAIKVAGEAAWRLAARHEMPASTLSRMIHGAQPVKPGDPRIPALARELGVPEDQAIEAFEPGPPVLERRSRSR